VDSFAGGRTEAAEWPDRCHLVRITAVLDPAKHEVNIKYLETQFLLTFIHKIMALPAKFEPFFKLSL
jgi:hypothetical protein